MLPNVKIDYKSTITTTDGVGTNMDISLNGGKEITYKRTLTGIVNWYLTNVLIIYTWKETVIFISIFGKIGYIHTKA